MTHRMHAASAGFAGTFRRFALVGGIGFCIDTALLAVLTGLAGWTPWHARLLSALAAIVATWLLNRNYTFAGRTRQRWSLEAVLYVATQICGLSINFAVFALCLQRLPRPGGIPIFAQVIAAAAALAFNFAVSNYALYSRRRERASVAVISGREGSRPGHAD